MVAFWHLTPTTVLVLNSGSYLLQSLTDLHELPHWPLQANSSPVGSNRLSTSREDSALQVALQKTYNGLPTITFVNRSRKYVKRKWSRVLRQLIMGLLCTGGCMSLKAASCVNWLPVDHLDVREREEMIPKWLLCHSASHIADVQWICWCMATSTTAQHVMPPACSFFCTYT